MKEFYLKDITEIEQVSQQEYNAHEINRIKKEYGALRQKSKAPS